MTLRSALLLGLIALRGAAACSIDDVELEGKACPCSEGYQCDNRLGRCIARGLGGSPVDGASGSSGGGAAGGDSEAGGWTEASGESGDGDGAERDAAIDDAVSDGCMNPKAIASFDATPPGGDGYACNSRNATGDADGMFAGLDCMDTTQPAPIIDGQPVCGCIGVDFGAAVNLDPLFVRVRVTPNACGTACTGAMCNTGHDLLVFKGRPAAYAFVQMIRVDTIPRDHPIASLGGPTQYIVVCRFAYSHDRDDMEIDAVRSGACG